MGRDTRKRWTGMVLAAGAILWLLACMEPGHSTQPVAGGTGSEAGDAYGVAWSVGREKVAVAAHVSLYFTADSQFTHPILKAEAETDSAGRFHFAIEKTGAYDLEIRGAAQGIQYKRGILLAAKGKTDLGALPLPEAARVRGKLPAKPLSPTRLWLVGTPYSALADSAGNYAFPSLPSGSFVLFSERNAGDTLERAILGDLVLNAGDSIAPPADTVPRDSIPRDSIPRDSIPRDSVPRNNIDSVASLTPYIGPGAGTTPVGAFSIEDFSDGGEQSTWGTGHGGCMWSARVAGKVNMTPFTGAFDVNTTATNGYKGRSLTVAYSATDTAGRAIVELSMDPLSSILQQGDTLVFHAKGGGNLRVDLSLAFGTAAVKIGSGLIALPIDWAEFHLAVPAGTGTAAAGNFIRFSGYGGFGYWLDDIELRPKR